MEKQQEQTRQPFKTLIVEIKLSRVWQYWNTSTPMAIISGMRGEYSPEENVKRNQQLAAKIREAGFGFSYIDGEWDESQPDGSKKRVSEISLLVAANEKDAERLFDFMKAMAQEFEQDAFVYKGTEANTAKLFDKNGAEQMKFDNMKYDELGYVVSRLRQAPHRGKPFYVENFQAWAWGEKRNYARLVEERDVKKK